MARSMSANGTSVTRGHRPDYMLILIVFVLLAFGLVMMYSISPILSHKLVGSTDRNYYFFNQIKYLIAGMLIWAVVGSIHYSQWRRSATLLLGVSILALLALLVPSLQWTQNGATRWVDLRLFRFQPAELLKLSLILYLAAWFERRGTEIRSFWDGLLPFSVILTAASLVVVILQRDMGTMLVLAGAVVGMYFAAGMRLDHLTALMIVGTGAGWLAIISFPHRLSRITAFLDPSKDASGASYHVTQALIAIGSGGIFGVGLGRSIQVYGYLPEAANDSIFAIVAEEFGLVGSLIMIVLFGLVVFRGLKIARQAPDTFSRLVAVGISLWLMFQAVINIAAMLALVPLTGIPLPLISYGGTNLIISLLAIGILVNISKYTVREATHADTSDRRRNRRTYHANSGNRRRAQAA